MSLNIESGLATQIRDLERRLKEFDTKKVNPTKVKEVTDLIKDLKQMLQEKKDKKEQRKKDKEQKAQEAVDKTHGIWKDLPEQNENRHDPAEVEKEALTAPVGHDPAEVEKEALTAPVVNAPGAATPTSTPTPTTTDTSPAPTPAKNLSCAL